MTSPYAAPGRRRDVIPAAAAGPLAERQRRAAERARMVDRTDQLTDYSGRWRRWLWPIIVAVVAAFGMLISGVPVWRSVVIAAGVAVALWAVAASRDARAPSWHRDLWADGFWSPSAWEVPGLDASRQSAEAFERYLRPRLWELARDLLQRRGIDPDSRQARDLVGQASYALLTGEDTDPRRMTSSVAKLCETVARLAVVPLPESPPPVANPSLAGLAGLPIAAHRGPAGYRHSRSRYRNPFRNLRQQKGFRR